MLLPAAQFAFAETESQNLQSLFAKMSRVPHTLDYQGSFTYEHQNSAFLQGFRISHWVEDGVEHERLLYLNGPEREITRQGKTLDCASPGDQILQRRLSGIGSKLIGLDQFYQYQIRHVERVAGRLATVLQVAPRDPFRYGYVLSIDQETGLVLSSLMVDNANRIIERYQFIELDLNPDVEALQKTPVAKRQRVANAQLGNCGQIQKNGPKNWNIHWVPGGFAFAGEQRVRDGIDMLMYTDGLTTFSIFIEPVDSTPPEGAGQRGATLVYATKVMRDNQLHRLTVVGEIPVAAAEQIAAGVVSKPTAVQ